MAIKISKMAQAIEPSLSRRLFNMAKEYEDVIDLTLGDPDLLPAPAIRSAACEAVMEGRTRYSANAGLPALREAIAKRFSEEYGMEVDPQSEIVVTVGGMEALFLTFACLLDPGDEVVVPAPYYVNYVQMIKMCGAVPVVVDSEEGADFLPSLAAIEDAITDRTVALLVNSPCNPTGAVMDADLLQALGDLAIRHDLVVVSDEVYRTLVYSEASCPSIFTVPGMRERTVVVNSVSKRFSMTGYRLGYAVVPTTLADSMTIMQENVAACAPLPSQYAALAAYELCGNDPTVKEVFEDRREALCTALAEVPGLRFAKPRGAFYLFVNVSGTGFDGLQFAYELLREEQVAVVPGITYGSAYGDYVRIAYTLDVSLLEEAALRIKRFVCRRECEDAAR